MKVTLIGIDLAKTIFQLCGVNRSGKSVFNKTVKRSRLREFLCQYPDATIAMEACGGSNYWGRTLQAAGFTVKLIPPQHVKPFVKGNKNDRNDAFAITEAANRPDMLCVTPRTKAQTDMIQVHRARSLLVHQRTALMNQMRGFMTEYGVILPQGKTTLLKRLPVLLDDPENEISEAGRSLLTISLEQCHYLNERIRHLDRQIRQQARGSEPAARLLQIHGVAEVTATAAIAYAGNGAGYHNGRHFAANLGLVPREHSSGGKQRFGQVSKRGNAYLRHCLIQGAWSVIRYADNHDDRLSLWARGVIKRRGKHKAAVAVANKLARIIWSMLYHQTEYRTV